MKEFMIIVLEGPSLNASCGNKWKIMYIWEDAVKKLIELDVRCKQTRFQGKDPRKKNTTMTGRRVNDEMKKRTEVNKKKGNEEKQTSLRNKTV